ncbi:YraN family protein [Acidiphilium sp. AL]|uniref:UPF0102 protein L2A60_08660 n=1 Tax=Acidiphilium iwatense TaxID=768198 RepID=A0ABS9DYJ0_9PROT|nr:YraN family protein [Acidiphilium iwatense]MCF3946751.1 YraN family protein [Acidiphilium iwatense]MCU4158721.1 YraN family protein [Acidiphilium sp. AL]
MNLTLPGLQKSAQRRRAELCGRDAESIAASWYEERGFAILARRLRTGGGELDLVVASRTLVIFVEVKARRHVRAAAESVSRRQQKRLAAAAEIALAENPAWWRDGARFDVVLVVGDAVIPIEDAFRPGDWAG